MRRSEAEWDYSTAELSEITGRFDRPGAGSIPRLWQAASKKPPIPTTQRLMPVREVRNGFRAWEVTMEDGKLHYKPVKVYDEEH